MLRLLVLVLLLANGVYFAWTQGLLQMYGFAPATQTEPQRLSQQIRPEAMQLLTEQEVRLLEAPPVTVAPAATCWQVGLLTQAQSVPLRTALTAWPAGSWSLQEAVEPVHWIVYMGKYANAAELAKKRLQLASLNLKLEPLTNPTLELGLSLGGFDTQAAANTALEALSRRGVRTARVLQERAEVRGWVLRLPAADEALRARLDELKPLLAGKAPVPCK